MDRGKAAPVFSLFLAISAVTLVFLLLAIRRAPRPYGLGVDGLPGICLFLSRPGLVYAAGALWLAADLALLIWLWRSVGLAARCYQPAILFLTWQGTKIAYFVLYFALAYFHRPYSLMSW